jgi:hypothetical protein
MHVALTTKDENDSEILLYSAGPANINGMCLEFANIAERTLKANGIKIRVLKVPPSWIKQNISAVDYFAFFSKPKESVSDLVHLAESKDVPVGVYRY